MTGLALVLLAFVFIVIETHVPSFGLFGLLAIISLLAGGNILVEQGEVFGYPVDWSLFIGVAIALSIVTVIFARVALKSFKAPNTSGVEAMIGKEAVVEDWDGKSGRVTIQGELWQAESTTHHHFKQGDKVRVASTNDLKLQIEAEK